MDNSVNKGSWLKYLLSFSTCKNKSKLVFSVILSFLRMISGLIPFFSIYKITEEFIEEKSSLCLIITWCIIEIIGYALKVLFFSISTYLSHKGAYYTLENLRLKIADKFLHAPLGKVQEHSSGEIKNVIVDKIEDIEPPLAHVIPEGLGHILLPVISFIVLIIIDWRIAFISLVTVPFTILCMGLTFKISEKNFDKYNKSNVRMNNIIVEYIQGIEVIKAFGRSGSSYAKYKDAITDYSNFVVDWLNSTFVTFKLAFALFPSTIVGVLPLSLAFANSGIITIPEAVLAVILSMSMVTSLGKIEVFSESLRVVEHTVNTVKNYIDMKAV